MNRKASQTADEGVNIGKAVTVLIIVALGVILIFGNTIIDKIKILLPGYNMTKPLAEGIEIIRYDLTAKKVQWYDGNNFYDFNAKGEAKVGKKNLDQKLLKKEFEDDWFYNNKLKSESFETLHPKTIEMLYDPCSKSAACPQIPDVKACVPLISTTEPNKNNDVIIKLVKEDSKDCVSKAIGGIVKVLVNGQVEILKTKIIDGDKIVPEDKYEKVSNRDLINTFNAIAQKWRSSMADEPISLTYQEDGKERETKRYCVIFYKPDKLKVDLAKPTESNDLNYKCPVEVH